MRAFLRRHPGVPALILLAPGLLYLAVFFVYPIVQMFLMSLSTGSVGRGYALTWDPAVYGDALSRYWEHLLRSMAYGLAATLLALALGFPLAYFIAFRGGRYKSLLLFLVIAPFFTSFLLRTISWRIIFADNGFLIGTVKDLGLAPESFHLLATPWAVLAGITYNFLPFMTLPLYVSLERIPVTLLEAGQDLYAGPVARFNRIVLPLAVPGIVAGSLLTFIPAVGDFVNAELLGNPRTQMIGNVIQSRFLRVADYPTGSALSFILMASILAAVLVYARLAGTDELAGGRAA